MKKVLSLIFVITLIISMTACTHNIRSSEEHIAETYIQSLGYSITAQHGEIAKYTLEKSLLNGNLNTIPYRQAWAVQKVEPDLYFGKEITVYGFTVNNHPLQIRDKNAINGVNLYIMFVGGKVIGGYSFPNADVDGGYYSLEGKTLEEITGLSYQQWSENWNKKYGD